MAEPQEQDRGAFYKPWADPQRDIAVSLMNTGKLVLGPHLKALPVLLDMISAECQPVVEMEGDVPLYQRGGHTR